MPPQNYRKNSRRSRLPRLLLGGFGLLTLMTFGIVGTLWLAGVPLNPFAKAEAVDDPFMVRIPINSRPIPAYTRVDRSQLLNPTTGGLMVQNVPPVASVGMSIVGIDESGSHIESKVESIRNDNDEVVFVVTGGAEVRQVNTFTLGGAMMNVNAIIGRVVKADKRAGLGFQENTFFPKGTPEGLAGATPTGMRAITLDATRLTGVHSLGAGDQIDLLANVPIDDKGELSEVELIAQSAKVLRPVYVRNEVSTSATLMQGNQTKNTPKYEVAIAVAADDVIRLQNAINQNLSITCIAHSMKPPVDGESDSIVMASDEVRVPVTVRPILAYNVVSRDAFVSPATRSIKTETISRQEADRIGAITSLGDALGAIVRQDIPAGRYLRQADLLNGPPGESGIDVQPVLDTSTGWKPSPHDGTQFVSMLQAEPNTPQAPAATAVGDRPAITRFIPPGMKAFAIPWESLYGSEQVQIGDQVDLMVSYPLERQDSVKERRTESDGTIIEREFEEISVRESLQPRSNTFDRRGEPWFVATDAIIVGPLGFPAPAPAERALAGANNPAAAKPPIIVAIADLDAENFAAVLATKEAKFSIAIHADNATRPGMKSIAICPVVMERYTKFDEAIWQNNRRRIISRLVDEDDPRFAYALSVLEIETYYGQVIATEKSRWDFFEHGDFLPVGTQPGIAAGATAGHTIAIVEAKSIEGLAAFESEDRVTILIRMVYRLPTEILYSGNSRAFPQGMVVVRDARILRRSVQGMVALELPDHESAAFQAAIARVAGEAETKEQVDSIIGNDQAKAGPSVVMIAVAQPRAAYLQRSDPDQVASNVQSFNSLKSIQLTEVFINAERTVYAFASELDSMERD